MFLVLLYFEVADLPSVDAGTTLNIGKAASWSLAGLPGVRYNGSFRPFPSARFQARF